MEPQSGLQSSVETFEPAGMYGATAPGRAAARNWRGAAALKVAVMALAVVAVLAVSGVFTSSKNEEVVLGGAGSGSSSMKTINTLLAHIDKITGEAKAGHKADAAVQAKLSGSDGAEDDDSDSAAPKAVRKGLGHVDKALQAAQAASASLKSAKGAAAQGKRKAIAAKMRALTAQINSDFQKVTGFGHKAGFLPPVKVPHM